MLEGYPKFIAIDEKANHKIVHRYRFGKANRATDKTLDPGPQGDVFTLDFLRMLLANMMLLWVDMPLVRPPSIGVKPRDSKRLKQGLQLHKDGVLPSSKDIRQHGPTVVINRMP